ncbi:MAG TPA: HlyD family secretion protein [Candidatus Polarisedimenticolaceae bacterium]|nr:HlyD family secretion protein [Candidatus Polarisedimenticolaceae bacterium]
MSEQPSALTPKRRRAAIAVIGGGALVAAIVGVAWWLHARTRESTDDAWIEGNIVTIAPRVGGTVQEVAVQDQQVVAADAVLVKIDRMDYEVALRRAEAEAADASGAAAAAQANVPITSATAGSQLAVAEAGVGAARRDAEAAGARLADAKATRAKTAADLERYRQLVAKDEVSRQQYDAAVAADTSAAATIQTAEAGVSSAQEKVRQAEAQLAAAESAPHQKEAAAAKLQSAEAVARKNDAAVEQAKLNLGYTTITAPLAGVVSRKTVQPGQVVQPGQPMMALVSLNQVWVVANFKEGQLRSMHPGQKASVYVDAYKRRFTGHVDAIGGATAGKFSMLPPENASGNFVKVVQRLPVKIVLDDGQDPDHRLRPGMSVVPTVFVK